MRFYNMSKYICYKNYDLKISFELSLYDDGGGIQLAEELVSVRSSAFDINIYLFCIAL